MTGHAEVVNVLYDPAKTSYEKMLDVFWDSHDPTTLNRQGNDVGTQYRSVIMYYSEDQKKLAEDTKSHFDGLLKAKGRNACTTEIVEAPKYYLAEDYRKSHTLAFRRTIILTNIIIIYRSAIFAQKSDGVLWAGWNWNLCATTARRSQVIRGFYCCGQQLSAQSKGLIFVLLGNITFCKWVVSRVR